MRVVTCAYLRGFSGLYRVRAEHARLLRMMLHSSGRGIGSNTFDPYENRCACHLDEPCVVGADLDRPPVHLDESGTAGYPVGAAINMLRVIFAQRILARSASTRENHAGQDVVGADRDQPGVAPG